MDTLHVSDRSTTSTICLCKCNPTPGGPKLFVLLDEQCLLAKRHLLGCRNSKNWFEILHWLQKQLLNCLDFILLRSEISYRVLKRGQVNVAWPLPAVDILCGTILALSRPPSLQMLVPSLRPLCGRSVDALPSCVGENSSFVPAHNVSIDPSSRSTQGRSMFINVRCKHTCGKK